MYQTNKWIVELEWEECYTREDLSNSYYSDTYIFDACEDALRFANKVCWEKTTYERFNKPQNIYLSEAMWNPDVCAWVHRKEDKLLSTWYDVDRKIKR